MPLPPSSEVKDQREEAGTQWLPNKAEAKTEGRKAIQTTVLGLSRPENAVTCLRIGVYLRDMLTPVQGSAGTWLQPA